MNMTTENNHDYRPASFRGVEFFVDGIEGTGGRRAVPHAYPKRETGWTEDNGAVLSQQKVTGFCLGDDYLVQLAAILEALNKPGPGEMVHPWWGRQRVQIGKVTHSLSTKNGGYATISFEVFEAGNPLFPSQVADTSEEVKSAASSAREATIEEFETQFETEELPSYAQESLLDTFNGYSDSLKEMVNQLPDLPDDIGNWIDAIDNFKNNVGLLMAYPGQLAMQVTDLIYDVHNLVTTPPAALDVFTSLKNRFDGMKAYVDFEDGNTVDKAVSRNKALTQQLFINSLATEQAQSLSDSLNAMTTTKNGDDSDFDSKRATELSNAVQASLDETAQTSLNNGMMQSWRALRGVRIALKRDVDERVLLLPEVREIKPHVTIPVALLAYQETGSTESRDGIIKRNKLRHPSFVMQGETVEIAVVKNG